MKHYYLYFFALIFSVTLYFSFMTLQYNPSIIEATAASGTATTGFKVASFLLYFIVLFFVLYANHLFIKQRSKEIGLYQLIGMTKGLVARLIALENIVLFVGAVVIGMVMGLLSSRLFAMILLKILHFDDVVALTFNKDAIVNTTVVFSLLLIVILIQMAWMVKRTTLLSLFTASKQADERVKRFSIIQMLIGAFGLALIIYGYYKSTQLFTSSIGDPFLNMLLILATTIGGTFLVFRYSVSFLLNLLRLSKKGHLNLIDVLAVTPIMHRMKGNAKSLTLITVLTAVSLAITTLSYISYYSADATAKNQVPADYISVDGREATFLKALEEKEIAYRTEQYEMTMVQLDLAEIVPEGSMFELMEGTIVEYNVLKLSEYQQIHPELHLQQGEGIITSYDGFMAQTLPLEAPFDIPLAHGEQFFPVKVKDVHDDPLLAWQLTYGAFVIVVEDSLFEQLKASNEINPLKQDATQQTSIYLADDKDVATAEELYKQTAANILSEQEGERTKYLSSLYSVTQSNLNMYGMTIFITAFLGLAFLLATGSILYFKQMSEADEEMASYSILRKIGYSQQEILRGVMIKQLFNFGVPLAIGLLHSYFAVKSGWFFFGTELVEPLIITMVLYIALYSIFAFLSINYYKKVIKQVL